MRYVWREGHFRDPRTGEIMPVRDDGAICCPAVRSDIQEYRSPINGKTITSRSQRRYDLEANGCVEAEPPKKKRGYRNAKFAAKRGLPLNEEGRDAVRI